MNPFLELGIPETSDDQTVRRAYLSAIQKHSPESDPARFQELNAAYELVKDEDRRHHWHLFHNIPPGGSPLDVLVKYTRLPGIARPMPAATFKTYLRHCAQ